MPVLSIIIPAYNESSLIGRLLDRIITIDVERLGFQKEIIVVNDGSTDNTEEVVRGFPQVHYFIQIPNQGKGKAVQRGIRESAGDYILIQDADLEYEPRDYPRLLQGLAKGDVVYGSRIIGQREKRRGFALLPGKHPQQGVGAWLAGAVLTVWTALIYWRWISDTLTAYKLYPAPVLRSMKLRTSGFETDHEITAKLIRKGLRIVEVPIDYHPRSREEGKKIKPYDGLIAAWTLLRFRIAD